MSYYNSYATAKKQAEHNAVYFNIPYIVFRDTSGNWRCEMAENAFEGDGIEIIQPHEVRKIRVCEEGYTWVEDL